MLNILSLLPSVNQTLHFVLESAKLKTVNSLHKQMTTKHLDLGCGPHPRNPYVADEIYGVDISPSPELPKDRFVRANLALEPIPFTSNSFDSVSAFDFIEHIPRQIHSLDNHTSRLPFIELMNEVWRVLKPNGVFYALTPAYPNPSAFQDPTHVNIITESTHT